MCSAGCHLYTHPSRVSIGAQGPSGVLLRMAAGIREPEQVKRARPVESLSILRAPQGTQPVLSNPHLQERSSRGLMVLSDANVPSRGSQGQAMLSGTVGLFAVYMPECPGLGPASPQSHSTHSGCVH